MRAARRPAALVIEGRIATLRGAAGFGWVDAIALEHGRVVAAGSRAEIGALSGPHTRMWRLRPDLIVAPSLTDAHLHCISAALAASQPDLTGLDLAAAMASIGEAHQRLLERGDRDGWLLGHGWSFEALGALPGATWLDAAAPGRPVALWAHDHHSRWVGTRAIELAGLDGRADPQSGHIDRDEHGRPTGILIEHAAGLVDVAVPPADAAVVEAALVTYARSLASLGVTSVHDPGGLAPDPELHHGPRLYRALAAAGRLPLRVMAGVREEQLDGAIGMGFRTGRRVDVDAQERYRDGWLKLFSDGALGSRTAHLLAPYETDELAGPPPGGPRGMPLRDAAQLETLTGRAAAAGIASQVHAIGDAAARTVLDVLLRTPRMAAACHRVEHAQLVDPADLPRFAAAGVAASVQPCHLISDAAAVRRAWGTRADDAFPFGMLAATGALLAFGTDAPVEPADPWRGLAAAVTRRGPGWPTEEALAPGQALDLARALRAACLGGPRSARIADQGHLDAGARADLVILPADAFPPPGEDGGSPEVGRRRGSFTPSAEDLAATRPLATLLDGELVWVAPGFDP